MARSIPVLYYHRVNPVDPRMATTPALFRQQLSRLSRAGWRALHSDELIQVLAGGVPPAPRSFMITFDDGYADNWLHAFPILREFGQKAVIFLIGSRIQLEGDPRDAGRAVVRPFEQANRQALIGDLADFLNVAEIRAMAESGLIELGAHTMDHRLGFVSDRIHKFVLSRSVHWSRIQPLGGTPVLGAPIYETASAVAAPAYFGEAELARRLQDFMAKHGGAEAIRRDGKKTWEARLRAEAEKQKPLLPAGRWETREEAETRVLAELQASRRRVESVAGRPCLALGWPWGHYSELAIAAARQAGYRLAFTTETGAVKPGDDPFRLNRVKVGATLSPARLEAIVSALSRPTLARAANIFARGQRR